MKKRTNKTKIKFILYALILAALSLAISACTKNGEDLKDYNQVAVDGKAVTLEEGDILFASVWNEDEYTFKGDELDKQPYLYGGVTIGSKLDKVLDEFGVKPGYAYVDREIDRSDGETDIIKEEYKDLDFFENEGVLDARFIFAYQKVDDQWILLEAGEVGEIMETMTADKETILYNIDFCGGKLASEERVNEKEVISFKVISVDQR